MTESARGSSTSTRGRAGGPAIALLGLGFAVAMLGTTLPTPLYARYAVQFGFGELVTTVVFATYAVGVVAGLLLLGHWSDQLGRRPMLLAGLGLSALSAALFLVDGGVGWLFAGRLVSGVSAGIFTGTATAAIVDQADEDGRDRAGLVAAVVNIGGLGIGPVLAGALTEYAPLPLRLCFVLDLVLVAAGLVAVRSARETVPRTDHPDLRPRRLGVPAQVRSQFVRAVIAGFAGFAVLGLFTAVSPAFIGTVLGIGNALVVGVIVFAVFAASVTGSLLSGRLGVDRALPLGCVGLIAGMVLLAVSLAASSLSLLVVGGIVAGIGQGLSFRAGLGSVVGRSPGEQRGSVTSTFFVVLYVGISVPVIGEGALAGGVGLVTAGVVFAVLVGVLAAVALALLTLRRVPVGTA